MSQKVKHSQKKNEFLALLFSPLNSYFPSLSYLYRDWSDFVLRHGSKRASRQSWW